MASTSLSTAAHCLSILTAWLTSFPKLLCRVRIIKTWSRGGDGENCKCASLSLHVGLCPWPFTLEETGERTIPSEHTGTKRLTGPVIATFCNRGSSHCVLFISEKKEKRCSSFSCTKFNITKNNIMKNHAAHTVIYVEDSSICVSSFFPSWL